MNWFQRKYFWWLDFKHSDENLNRRATVEQLLLDAAKGKRATPTPNECYELAMYLGVRGRELPKGIMQLKVHANPKTN